MSGESDRAARLNRVADQHEITDVIYRYCRGIDRCDFELVRSCYHADATDDHGDFRGGVDAFIEHISVTLPRFDNTMHFIGNVLADPVGDRARVESYAVAYHRLPPSRTKPERDFVAGLRYVDDFERRAGEWRIAARVVAFEWSRVDPVGAGGWIAPEGAFVGLRSRDDIVYADALPRDSAPRRAGL